MATIYPHVPNRYAMPQCPLWECHLPLPVLPAPYTPVTLLLTCSYGGSGLAGRPARTAHTARRTTHTASCCAPFTTSPPSRCHHHAFALLRVPCPPLLCSVGRLGQPPCVGGGPGACLGPLCSILPSSISYHYLPLCPYDQAKALRFHTLLRTSERDASNTRNWVHVEIWRTALIYHIGATPHGCCRYDSFLAAIKTLPRATHSPAPFLYDLPFVERNTVSDAQAALRLLSWRRGFLAHLNHSAPSFHRCFARCCLNIMARASLTRSLPRRVLLAQQNA